MGLFCFLRCGSHLQDGPIETQQDAPRLVPNSVQAVGEAAQEELVAQTTPGGQTVNGQCNYFFDVGIVSNNLMYIHTLIQI